MRMRTWIGLMALVGLVMAGTDLRAQEAEAEAENDAEITLAPPAVVTTEDQHPLVVKYREGGKTMHFLAFLSVMGVAFVVERLMSLNRRRMAPPGLAAKVDELWKQGDFEGVERLGRSSGSTLGKIVAFLAKHHKSDGRDLAEGAADIARRDLRKHYRRAYPLAVVASLSPLLGLLGTVIGLLDAFQKVAVAGTMDDPSILAGSIALALVTTATGLIIAVPALAAYHFFKNRTGDLADNLDEDVSELMNAWFLTS